MTNPILDFNLGAYIQISYTKGLRNQLSEDFRDWEMINKCKVGGTDGREKNFMFKNGYGPASQQYSNVRDYGFAKGQQISVSEHTARYQDMDCTIEFDYKLWDRARKNPDTYGDFLAEELSSKVIVQKRQLCKDLYGDGTGIVLTAASAVDDAGNAKVTVTDKATDGHIGNCEYDDVIIFAEQTGALVSPTGPVGGTFYAYIIVDFDRDAGTVTLQAIDEDYTPLTSFTSSNIVDTNCAYRVGLDNTAARVDRTAITDYGQELYMPGLRSLAANDGRTVHGITMGGRTGATEDATGGALSTAHIERVLNKMKIRTGEGAYSWKVMTASPETHTFFILSREADRRFNTVDDTKRGGKMFGYQHRTDFLELYASEFVEQDRIYMLPEAKTGNKVLEMYSTDYETVKVNDTNAFHLAVNSNGYQKKVQTFMTAKGTLVCKHPAAIGVVSGFTL